MSIMSSLGGRSRCDVGEAATAFRGLLQTPPKEGYDCTEARRRRLHTRWKRPQGIKRLVFGSGRLAAGVKHDGQ